MTLQTNGFAHRMEEMFGRDHSFELGVNYLIKQTNGFALPDIQGIPTENERSGVLPCKIDLNPPVTLCYWSFQVDTSVVVLFVLCLGV